MTAAILAEMTRHPRPLQSVAECVCAIHPKAKRHVVVDRIHEMIKAGEINGQERNTPSGCEWIVWRVA